MGYVGPVSDKDLEELEDPDPLLQIPKFQIGKIGVERWMEDNLRGSAGTKRIEVNSVGRVMRELERKEGIAGTDHPADHRRRRAELRAGPAGRAKAPPRGDGRAAMAT